MFAGAGLKGLRLRQLGECPGAPFPEPAEVGRTFVENATIKALAYAGHTGMACLADDSGLEVDALGGAPGVISSHYATAGRETGLTRAARDEANNRALLANLAGVSDRTARFVCVMALALPGPSRVAHLSRGVFEGRIGEAPAVPRGANGFGYDPLFLVAPEFTRTGAELSPPEKNGRSHRAAAARDMGAWLLGSGLI